MRMTKTLPNVCVVVLNKVWPLQGYGHRQSGKNEDATHVQGGLLILYTASAAA